MINDFDKEFLKESLFNDLMWFQQCFERPNLIGLIQIDNCLDSTALHEFIERTYEHGNLSNAYRHYNRYQKTFQQYLDIIGDDNIYPSKEVFLSQLFINGEYEFLNFTSNNSSHARYIDSKEGVSVITTFEPKDFSNINGGYNRSRKVHTRIKKGNVIRFFDRELTHERHFNDISCYLTLSIDGLTDDEFNKAFNASHYKIETMSIRDPIQFTVHKLIKRMIELGDKYTEKNQTGEGNDIRMSSNSFQETRVIHLIDMVDCLLTTSFQNDIIKYKTLEIGTIIKFSGDEYVIQNIKSLEKSKTIIIVDKRET